MRRIMQCEPGCYRNPADRQCFEYCTSCGRCRAKGTKFFCSVCSGRFDPEGKRVPCIDDYCRCTQGVLQWVTQEGRLIRVKMRSNPFSGVVKYDKVSDDESDWESYMHDMRERFGQGYDPIQFDDGTSTDQWLKDQRNGN